MKFAQVSVSAILACHAGFLLALATTQAVAGSLEPQPVCGTRAFATLRSMASSRGMTVVLDDPAAGVMVLSQKRGGELKRTYFQVILQRLRQSHDQFAMVYSTQLTGEVPPEDSDSTMKEIAGQLRGSSSGQCIE